MALIEHKCMTVACDACGDELEDGDGGIVHFPTDKPNDMELWMDDWRVWIVPPGGEGARTYYWHDDCIPNCTCGHLFGEHDYGEQPCENNDDETPCPCKQFVPQETTK